MTSRSLCLPAHIRKHFKAFARLVEQFERQVLKKWEKQLPNVYLGLGFGWDLDTNLRFSSALRYVCPERILRKSISTKK